MSKSHSESNVQARVRLEAARKGVRLWRNNVGVLKDTNGRPVRFGLANDSTNVNEMLKSGDLIGFRTVVITPEMVGRRVAVFVSRECKAEDWTWSGTDREVAQRRWMYLVNEAGGDASFATDDTTL